MTDSKPVESAFGAFGAFSATPAATDAAAPAAAATASEPGAASSDAAPAAASNPDEERVEEADSTAEYQPLVQLKPVEVQTGEEQDEVVYKQLAAKQSEAQQQPR